MKLDETDTADDSQWTVTSVILQVDANPRLGRSDFDIRPFLPDDATSATHRVLRAVERLARRKPDVDGSQATTTAFTQAGLRYGAMADHFDRCDHQAPQLGDLLVDADGSVTMAIDVQRRIGWGGRSAEKGVEFRALRSAVTRKACWRHRQLAEEARTGRGLPGLDALGRDPCQPASCLAAATTPE
jgi:hypothetical protein